MKKDLEISGSFFCVQKGKPDDEWRSDVPERRFLIVKPFFFGFKHNVCPVFSLYICLTIVFHEILPHQKQRNHVAFQQSLSGSTDENAFCYSGYALFHSCNPPCFICDIEARPAIVEIDLLFPPWTAGLFPGGVFHPSLAVSLSCLHRTAKNTEV